MKYALILPVLLTLSACSESPEDLLAKAEKAYATRNFNVARLYATQALREDPDNRRLLLIQARSLLELGDGDAAGTAIARLAQGRKPTGEVALLAGEAAMLRQAPDVVLEAVADEHGIKADQLRAFAYLNKQDVEAARRHIMAAVAAGGTGRVLADAAQIAMIAGDLPAAEALQVRAEQTAPKEFATLLIGGEIAERKGETARALAYFDRTDKLFPGNIAVMTARARALADLGRFTEMAAALDPLVQAVPNDPDVVLLRARLAQSRSDWIGIRALVQPHEYSLEADNPVRVIYAEALLRLGQAHQAIAQLQPLVRSAPDDAKASALLAEAQRVVG